MVLYFCSKKLKFAKLVSPCAVPILRCSEPFGLATVYQWYQDSDAALVFNLFQSQVST